MVAKMGPKEAWLYAASWGSYTTSGDQGACMYGFNENCCVQSESHREQVLNHIENDCRPLVLRNPEDYDKNEIEQMNAFVEYIKTAPVAA